MCERERETERESERDRERVRECVGERETSERGGGQPEARAAAMARARAAWGLMSTAPSPWGRARPPRTPSKGCDEEEGGAGGAGGGRAKVPLRGCPSHPPGTVG